MDVRPINPFIIGPPVSALKFIGRREQINTILSQLANPAARGGSAISGERRIGKTSLLHYISGSEAAIKYGLPPDRFMFVSVDGHALDNYVNRLGLQIFTEDVFWRYVAQFLAHFTQRASPLALLSRLPGFELLVKVLGRFLPLHKQDKIGILDPIKLSEQIAADGKLVVLLLDEFEWIINNTNSQRPTLLNTLRSLINLPIEKRGFAVITSSEEPLNVLCKDIKFSGSPFPNSLVPVHLRPFSTTEAYELIDEYLKGTAVAFSDEDKDFAYGLSEGHPYWLQRVCFKLFDRYLEKVEGNSAQATQTGMVLDTLDYEKVMIEIMMERGRDFIPSIREREREAQPSPKIGLPPTPRKFKIFVSSTSLDLQRERQAVEEALHRMCIASFSGMEYFGSRPETPKEVCLEEVSCADMYVGIFAHRYGYIDPESGLSMTELEYRKARECDIPCLIYMMDPNVPVPSAHIGQEPEAAAKLRALKQDLLSKHAVSFFTNPDNLAMKVVAGLNNVLAREREARPAPKAIVDVTQYSNMELTKEFFRSAGFDVEEIAEATYKVKSSQPAWTEWGELLVHCFEKGDVRGEDILKVVNEIALKDTGEVDRTFIVHSGRLIEGAAHQLWEYKTRQTLVIIPIHVTTLCEQLVHRGRNPDACSQALLRLEKKWSALGNPYQSVDSKTDSQWFFGSKRRMATEEMLQQIDEGVKAALIYGMRRVGKSAFLNQIYRDCRSRGYLTAKWVSKYGSLCHDILNDIKQELTSSLTELYPGINVPDPSVFTRRYDANTFSRLFRQDLLQLAEALDRHTGKAVKIVILLDEVDWIFPRQESSDETYLSYCNLFQTLKEVLEMPDKPGLLSLVVSMESPLINEVDVFPHNERFQNPMLDRFKTSKKLLFMEREDLDEMIQTIGQLRGLEYSSDSLGRIFERTRGHVALARKLCSCIVSLREREKLTGNVRMEEAVKAEESLLAEESRYFLRYLWRDHWSHNLNTEQLVLLELASSPDCSGIELEKQLLLKDDSTQMRQRIYYALNRLQDLGLIEEREQENELYYYLTIPIYRRWIRDYLPDVEKPGGWQ